jgi:peptidyl-prolyl cis-trans isomerase D
MFDLFRSREKSVRILLGALLVLVALSMLTYLIPSYNTGGNTSDTVVAEVGGEPISLTEVQRLVQNTIRGRQLPPEVLPNFLPQMIDQMITDRALAYEAQRLGFEVTDQQVADAIRQYVPNLFPDGKFIGRDYYAGLLAQQNLTIPEFEADMKRQMLITRLRGIAAEGIIVTPQEIEQEFRKRNEKIKIEYVKISPDRYKAEVQPSMEDMQNYFKVNTATYTVPEKRNLAILTADQAKLEQNLHPTDADLQRIYTQNQNAYRVPETVKVRHILLKTEGKPAADDAKIKAQAEDILKQVKAGADFKALVAKYSEDPGSKDKGGEYEVQRGQMVPEFEQAAFSLKPGESQIVKTQYGYHIVQVLKHDQARLKPFDEVKDEIASQWKKQTAANMMQQIADNAQATLQKDPTHPEAVAASLNMTLVRADNVEAGKSIPEIGPSPDFEQAIAGLKRNEVSQPVALPDNKIAIAVVTEVIPARPMTFQEAESQVRDAIVKNRLAVAVQTHAKELLDKARADGGDLAKAAKSIGLEVKTTNDFGRNDSVEGIGSAAYVQEAFGRPDGTIFGPVSVTDATLIGKVVSHVPPDMSKLAEQRNAIRDDIKSQKARDRNTLFEAGLREALVKQGKIKYHEDVIKRLIASYAGNNS